MDGVFASGMIGLTQEYFTPLLLFLGESAREVGVLVSLPNLVASLAQLKTIDFIRTFSTRKRVITTFVLLQALTLLGIASLAALGTLSVRTLIVLTVLFTASGAIALPAWGRPHVRYHTVRKRGAIFGWRNKRARRHHRLLVACVRECFCTACLPKRLGPDLRRYSESRASSAPLPGYIPAHVRSSCAALPGEENRAAGFRPNAAYRALSHASSFSCRCSIFR
jgi:hypothetical protein